MLLSAVVFSLLGVSLGLHTEVPQLDGRIVGGEPIDIEQAPYQVSVLNRGSHICGGSIISPKYVVTAGHCTFGFLAFLMSVRAGSSIRGSGGEVVRVEKYKRHRRYNTLNTDYDIAILILKSDLTLGAPIPLPSDNQIIPPGTPAQVSGWGRLREGGSSGKQLQIVTVSIVSQDECKKAYGRRRITDRMLCAGVPGGGKDACQGDSGGPLIANGVLAGVVSWGKGCARPRYPGVYCNVPVVRDFIREVTGI